jgi:hypothetical protein
LTKAVNQYKVDTNAQVLACFITSFVCQEEISMETLLSMPLPMALSLMMISAIAVYFFFKLLGILDESPRYVRRVRVARQSLNTAKASAQ